METCLGDLKLNWCLIYLNDMIVFSKMPKDHVVQLRAVFKKLKEAGLKLKTNKCRFFKKSLTYLGHRMSEGGIETNDIKILKKFENGLFQKQSLRLEAFLLLAIYL